LLANEPTGSLDSRTTDEIMRLIVDITRAQGITVLMVTHEPDVAAYARRVVLFKDGQIDDDVRNAERS
jgi:putative ABC transport system ATP-binding protein